MTSVSKNVYIDKLDDIINKFDKTHHRTIKVKPVDVKPSTCVDSHKEISEKDSKFEISDTVRISKYKNIFAKGYVRNWSEEVFWLKKLKTLCRGHMLLLILKPKNLKKKIFYKKEIQRANQKEFRVEEVIKRTGDKLNVNRKTTIVPLTVGWIKKTKYKWVNILQNRNLQEEEWKLN